jgi:hypothetical protein
MRHGGILTARVANVANVAIVAIEQLGAVLAVSCL